MGRRRRIQYNYNAATSELRIWDILTGMRPDAPTLSFTGTRPGNAVEVFAKRQAQIRITEVDGHAVGFHIGDIGTDGSETVLS